jgi:hypothetical protein
MAEQAVLSARRSAEPNIIRSLEMVLRVRWTSHRSIVEGFITGIRR